MFVSFSATDATAAMNQLKSVLTVESKDMNLAKKRKARVKPQRSSKRRKHIDLNKINASIVHKLLLMGRRTDGWGVMVVPAGSIKNVFQFPLYTMETGTVVSTKSKSKPETTPHFAVFFWFHLIHTKTLSKPETTPL